MTNANFPELNRLFGGQAPKRQPKTKLVIQWSDGQVTQVTKRGRNWSWVARTDQDGGHGAESSHLDGIRDHLNHLYRSGSTLTGELVRVPV